MAKHGRLVRNNDAAIQRRIVYLERRAGALGSGLIRLKHRRSGRCNDGEMRKAIETLLSCLMAMISIIAPGAPVLAGPPSSVATVVRESGMALGVAALAHAQTIDESGPADVVGIKGTSQSWQDLRSGTFATSVVAGPLSGDNGYDGKSIWNRDPFGVVWDDGSRDAYYGALEAAFVGSYGLWKPGYGGASVMLGAPQTLAGKRYDVLNVTPSGGLPFDFWFDATTHLPFRTVVPIGIITTTTTLNGYRAFSGLQIPVTQKQETVQGATTITIADVRFDGAETAGHLARPKSTVADFSIAKGAQTSVPIELVDNHVYLDVSVNGKGPYRFAFDTGATLIVDTALAKTLGLGAAGSVQGMGVGSATDTFNYATIDSLAIGDAKIGHLNAGIAPVRAGFSVAGGKPIDGLIGFETLARFVTTFDYGKRQVTFRMPGAPLPSGGKTVAFAFNGTDPMVPCNIGGVDGTCTIDTGSRSALDLYGPFAKTHPSLVTGQSAVGIGGYGVGGPAFGTLGRTTLDVGGYTVPRVIAGVSAQEKGAFANPFLAGNIGGGVWRRFALTLDYSHRTMTLMPDEQFAASEAFDRSGLFLLSQAGKIVVADARPGTPAAAAGIVRGDTLASIDGKSTATMTLKDIRDRLMQAAGTAHALVVSRKDGSLHDITLTLRDYV